MYARDGPERDTTPHFFRLCPQSHLHPDPPLPPIKKNEYLNICSAYGLRVTLSLNIFKF